jgi:hypothetical protein
MATSKAEAPRARVEKLPQWVKPQLTKLEVTAPEGPEWLHEIKFDGYRLHARLDLTRTGLDWTHKYPALQWQCPRSGEGGLRTTSFSMIQSAAAIAVVTAGVSDNPPRTR